MVWTQLIVAGVWDVQGGHGQEKDEKSGHRRGKYSGRQIEEDNREELQTPNKELRMSSSMNRAAADGVEQKKWGREICLAVAQQLWQAGVSGNILLI